jgi:hypothetical protein
MARKDADLVGTGTELPFGRLDAVSDSLHHPGRVKPMRLGHEPGTIAVLGVIDTLAESVFHVLIGHTPHGVVIYQHPHHPLEAFDEYHDTRLRSGHLHIRPQLEVNGEFRPFWSMALNITFSSAER